PGRAGNGLALAAPPIREARGGVGEARGAGERSVVAHLPRDRGVAVRGWRGELRVALEGRRAHALERPAHVQARPGHTERRNLVEVRAGRSEEHTSELQSRSDLVCRLLLEKKKKKPRSQ